MMLTVCHYWITGLWIVLVGYWVIAATYVKREARPRQRRTTGAFHLALAILLATFLAVRSPQIRAVEFAIYWSEPMAVAGAVVTTLGVVIAFSARAAIGRNWGAPGTRKTTTDLVTAGPYRFVRHPDLFWNPDDGGHRNRPDAGLVVGGGHHRCVVRPKRARRGETYDGAVSRSLSRLSRADQDARALPGLAAITLVH